MVVMVVMVMVVMVMMVMAMVVMVMMVVMVVMVVVVMVVMVIGGGDMVMVVMVIVVIVVMVMVVLVVMDNVTSLGNIRILKRSCCLVISALAVMLLYTYSSGSARVHSGTFEGNTRWYYDTRTKTVTIDCKGRMVTVFVRVS